MTYEISRRVVLFGALPAACGLAKPSEAPESRGKRTADAPAAPAPPAPAPIVDVRTFGASPTASAAVNSAAFAAASRAINREGGGTLLIPPGEYRVGAQERRGGRMAPVDIVRIDGCRRPVLIRGPGARLTAADGLRYGAFHPRNGAALNAPGTSLDIAARVDAYIMIHVVGCSASVRIEGMRLDGNMANYVLGGEWGGTGRQVTADGIICEGNTGPVTIVGVRSHDHGRDGIMLIHAGLTPRSPRYPVTLTDVTCEGNGRQGLSWVGGTQLTITRGRFNRTGRGKVASAPSAGFDAEAEASVCRGGRFVDCEFADNAGVGFVAEAGDVADLMFDGCTFIGTTNWSAWPHKPGITFSNCLFVGSIINVHGDADPRRATQFLSCRFHADPSKAPGGRIYGEYLANLGGGATNVLMKDCDFVALAPDKALLWTPPDMRFQDCRFRQVGTAMSHVRGIWSGVNRIDSPGYVNFSGSRFLGSVTLNGRRVP